MDKAAKIKLKNFIEERIPFHELKQLGFFDKSIRKTDYEKIAERVCQWFGYNSIYEYKPICRGRNCDGDCHATIKSCPGYNPLKGQDFKIKTDELVVEMATKDRWLN